MTKEEEFQEQNGMTIEQAWEKVQNWATAGKKNEAQSGCVQILKIFPEHVAKDLLQKLESEALNPIPEVPQTEISPEKKEEDLPPPTFSEKLKGAVSFIITGKKPEVLMRGKKHAQSLEKPSESPDTQKSETLESSKNESSPPQKPVSKSINMVGVSTVTPRKIDESLPEENTIEDDERMFGAISYIPFLCFFTLFSRKDSRFIQYHGWQGFSLLAIFLVSLPVYFLLAVLSLFSFLFWVLYLLFFVLVFFAMWTAWNGNYLEIPFISSLARILSGRKKELE